MKPVFVFGISICLWTSLAVGQVPLPRDVVVTTPDSAVKKEIAALSGRWAGNWSGILDAVLIVEQIGSDTAKVIYAWGNAPQWNLSADSQRFDAKVLYDDPAEIEFGSSRVMFNVKMESGQSTVRVTRSARNGTSTATFSRVSEAELLAKTQAAVSSNTEITPPGPDVPKECAAFSGRWTGNWPGYGQTWLWVVEVGANCVAKCMSWTTSAVPSRFQSCDIKDNVLVRQKSDGAEYYELRGDEIWARYVYSGGQNNAVFRKLKPGEK